MIIPIVFCGDVLTMTVINVMVAMMVTILITKMMGTITVCFRSSSSPCVNCELSSTSKMHPLSDADDAHEHRYGNTHAMCLTVEKLRTGFNI